MIKLGKVKNIQTINNMTIVSIHLSTDNLPSIHVGSSVHIENTGTIIVDGFKLWHDLRILDFIFQEVENNIKLNSTVHFMQ